MAWLLEAGLDNSRVLSVPKHREQARLDGYWKTLAPKQLAGIEGVAIDMWDAFENAIRAHVPNAADKIVFDTVRKKITACHPQHEICADLKPCFRPSTRQEAEHDRGRQTRLSKVGGGSVWQTALTLNRLWLVA
jgi:hypothetical protein